MATAVQYGTVCYTVFNQGFIQELWIEGDYICILACLCEKKVTTPTLITFHDCRALRIQSNYIMNPTLCTISCGREDSFLFRMCCIDTFSNWNFNQRPFPLRCMKPCSWLSLSVRYYGKTKTINFYTVLLLCTYMYSYFIIMWTLS